MYIFTCIYIYTSGGKETYQDPGYPLHPKTGGEGDPKIPRFSGPHRKNPPNPEGGDPLIHGRRLPRARASLKQQTKNNTARKVPIDFGASIWVVFEGP